MQEIRRGKVFTIETISWLLDREQENFWRDRLFWIICENKASVGKQKKI